MTMKLPENEIDLEAIRWALLAEKGPLSGEQRRELENWLGTSSRHRGAYARATAMLLHLGRLGSLAAGGDYVSGLPSVPYVTRRMVLAAGLAAVALVGGGGWLGREWIAEAWNSVRY